MEANKRIGLSLSGGGFRATTYHIGTLKKLNEMGILKDIDVISSNSGGSITNAYYALHKGDFASFESGLKNGVKSNVIMGVLLSWRFLLIVFVLLIIAVAIVALLFTSYYWLSFVILVLTLLLLYNYQFSLLPISKIVEHLYNRFFFKDKLLGDFADKHVFAINSTNVETGRLFTFSKDKMSDSFYEYPRDGGPPILFRSKPFPVARAVSASTCVPFAFTPVGIAKGYFIKPEDYNRVKPKLVDGGVYDNQGIHKITQAGSTYECDVIITSDAGTNLEHISAYQNLIQLLMRTGDIFMNRIKNFQMMKNVFENAKQRDIAYFSLGWDLDQCIPGFISNLKNGNISKALIKAHHISQKDIDEKLWDKINEQLKTGVGYERILQDYPSPDKVNIARSVKTSLSTLKDEQIEGLIGHAYCMTELQVRLYCPSLVSP